LNFNLENFNLDSIPENTPTTFFNLATATNDNVLNTIGKAIATIDDYNNGAITRSEVNNILSQTQVSIRNTQLSVNTTMTSIGARQNTLDNIINSNCEISDVKKEAKATISEVDLYEVTTDLTKTQTYLQMAMTSFNYVTGTSLFDYIH
jgi:flagellin-like hook-associated protein FlgL